MKHVWYLVIAYLGAAALYLGYVARLLIDERRLEGRAKTGRAP